MDVMFEMQRRACFSIEVGFEDTVLDIKEKILKNQGIPISEQTLIFNGQVLQDYVHLGNCLIFHNSLIQLIVAPNSVKTELTPLPTTARTKLVLKVKIPTYKTRVPIEMDANDTVLKVKQWIHEGVSVNRAVVHRRGTELQDRQFLRDCAAILSDSEIEVTFRPLITMGGSKRKSPLMVLVKSGTAKIPVEVNASDRVGELRKVLQNLVPDEDYFFLHKHNVMEDHRSFRWHIVGQGDTIEIFPRKF